jgi:hypothetical protein
MKARLILLSLATALLLSCSANDDEIMNYQFKNDAMKIETRIVSDCVAGVIQKSVQQFNCNIIEIALAGGRNVRVSVEGKEADLEALFEYAYESEEPATL